MSVPPSDPGSRSPLGHVIVPDWKQQPDEQQLAKALLRIAATIADKRRQATSTKARPTEQEDAA